MSDVDWLVDKDGDLWHLVPSGRYRCVTQDAEDYRTMDELSARYGPLSEPVWTVRAAE